jgi:hypothetical protein
MVNFKPQIEAVNRQRDFSQSLLAQSLAPQQNQNALTGVARILSAYLANKNMGALNQQEQDLTNQQGIARRNEMSRILGMTQDRPAESASPNVVGPPAPARSGVPLAQALMGSEVPEFQNMGMDASLKQAMEAQKSGGQFFDGGGIEGESLNRYLMSLPPEQRDAAANELARQRLSRQTTLTTPDGTMIMPGYNLNQPAATPPNAQLVPKQTTDAERLASGYAERMSAAENIFSELSGKGFDPVNTQDAAGAALPGIAEAVVTSPEYKSYRSAAEDWITANLRKESGATITPQEFDRDFKKYFPQPLDPPEVQQQKAQARKLAEQNVRFASGKAGEQRTAQPAVNNTSGPQPGAVEDGYRFKGGDPKDPNSWEPM